MIDAEDAMGLLRRAEGYCLQCAADLDSDEDEARATVDDLEPYRRSASSGMVD